MACAGQLDAARQAPEKLHLQLPLHETNLPAERRLLHVEPLRGAGDVRLLGNSNEIPKVSQVDCHTKKVSLLIYAYHSSSHRKTLSVEACLLIR